MRAFYVPAIRNNRSKAALIATEDSAAG